MNDLMKNPFWCANETMQFLELVRHSPEGHGAHEALNGLPSDNPVRRYLANEIEVYDLEPDHGDPDTVLELINKIGSEGLAELFAHGLSKCRDMDCIDLSGISHVMTRFEEQRDMDAIKYG
jgi:hypothetical protein